METYLTNDEFNRVKCRLQEMIDDLWEVPKMVACIYDLFQDYLISETQEQVLYAIADPFEEFNECSDYWRDMDYMNPLLDVIL